ncbi:malectin domain-containing carbohydrate-binding protein [Pontibacter sp. BT731]|nr:malectin domain-containing carbohydrate-binding protein [Pontibacter sp. BT731]MDO6391757.1 malectin domain-containing carbohydrate-binding protein [Pontibacter sp. BT731]
MYLKVVWASKAIHTDATKDGEKTYDLGPVEKDKWLDFVYHINFSYKSDGVLEVWKNGVKVVDHRGPNSYNDQTVPYFKYGIYKRNWENISKRVIYVDDVRVGSENATYNDVAPSRSTSSTTSTITSTSSLINAGGSQLTDSQSRTWSADANYSGGLSTNRALAIANTTDDALYRYYRIASNGAAINYSVPVKEAGNYTVKLHFVEPYFKASNSRVFNVNLEGQRVLTNYDIYNESGYARAVVKTFNVSVSDGVLNINLGSVKNNAIISAIEVTPVNLTSLSTSTSSASSAFSLINAGGKQLTDSQSRTWSADANYSGGLSTNRALAIANTTDDALYRYYRIASNGAAINYSVPVKEAGNYTVKLHFVEPYFKASNSRVFNVNLEGQRVLTNYDIYNESGYARAVVKTFNVSVSDGVLNINLGSVKNNAIISAIEVLEQYS